MSETPSWERQPHDTDKSFEAFGIYRDMGNVRSLRSVVQKLSKSLTLIARWSGAHNWLARVRDYDDYQVQLHQGRKLQKQIEIEDNVVSDYDLLRRAIEKRKGLLDGANHVAKIHELHDLLALMKRADDYARRAVGLPDRITESELTGKDGGAIEQRITKVVKAEDLTDDELATLAAGIASKRDSGATS